MTDQLERDNLAISERYFKHAVARVILFRSVEKMISNSAWYDGGFRDQTVTYSIAYLSFLVKKFSRFIYFNSIWETQNLPDDLINLMGVITKGVYNNITSPPPGTANISQWCKKEGCWESVKKINVVLDLDAAFLIDKEDFVYTANEDKKPSKSKLALKHRFL